MAIDVEQTYAKYGPMVMRRCRQLLRDEALAADAVQEVFVQALLKKDTLSGTYPSSLFYTMATNVSLNIIRQRKRRLVASGDDVIDQIAELDDAFDAMESRSLLDRIFARHKVSSRVIAVLHFVDGMTLEEVAAEVKMSVSGVRKRIRLLQAEAKNLKEVPFHRKGAKVAKGKNA